MTAKRTTRSSASAGPAANEQLATMTAWQGDALNAATRAGQAYAQGLVALNQELMAFMQSRWRHDVELGESLMHCRDWQAAADLQRDWLAEASREYADEGRKLFELGSTLMRDCWGPMEKPSAAGAEGKAGATQS